MTSQGNTSLRFVTWNTRGIRSPPEKFSNVLHSLDNLQADIVFIQETRVGPTSYQILTDVKGWKVYFTVHHQSSKGVAILIKNSLPFNYICHDEDCSGGYIVLFCHLYGELYTLVNVYNHNADRFVLGRLKEYLMESAEGVLVVGGDFNTALHPCIDRSPSASRHSPLRMILEDFTVSLNLRDTWSYLHFADEGFTRHQSDRHSRIDMFFMHSDTVGRALNITVEHNEISDHDPVVLELEVQQQTGNIVPKVASLIKGHKNNRSPIRMSGMISGAEILSVIKALVHSREQRPGQRQVGYYKKNQCPLTEILKIKYNDMLKTNFVSKTLKKSNLSQGRHLFNVDYLIFSQILAKRLRAFNSKIQKKTQKIASKKNITAKLDKILTVTFKKGTQNIKCPFLEPSREIENDLKTKLSLFAPPAEFRILKRLLPAVQGSSGKLSKLLPDCPLTSTILNLALNKLDWILNSEKEYRSSVCFERQSLFIYAHNSKREHIVRKVRQFQKDSGIVFDRKFHKKSAQK